MMYCPHCGRKIDENSVFCQYCGYRIVNIQSISSSSSNDLKQSNDVMTSSVQSFTKSTDTSLNTDENNVGKPNLNEANQPVQKPSKTNKKLLSDLHKKLYGHSKKHKFNINDITLKSIKNIKFKALVKLSKFKIIMAVVTVLAIVIGVYEIHWPASVPSSMQNHRIYDDKYDAMAYVIHGKKMVSFDPDIPKYKTNFKILKVKSTHFGRVRIIYADSEYSNNHAANTSAIGKVRETIYGEHHIKEKSLE